MPVPRANSLRSPPPTITSGCCVTVSCFLNQMYKGLKSHPTVKHFLPGEPLPRGLKCVRENSISVTSLN